MAEGIEEVPGWARPSTAMLVVDADPSVSGESAEDLARIEAVLAPHTGQMVALAMVSMHLGPADRALANLAVRRGDLDAALDRILAATAQADAASAVLWSGWCARDEAAIRAARGEPFAALLDEAAGVTRALGSRRLGRAVEALRPR